MSTRAQICITGEVNPGVITLYRHHDGSPNEVKEIIDLASRSSLWDRNQSSMWERGRNDFAGAVLVAIALGVDKYPSILPSDIQVGYQFDVDYIYHVEVHEKGLWKVETFAINRNEDELCRVAREIMKRGETCAQ